MIPLKLEINNLFAYDKVKIDFKKFDGPILIKGRNNTGKSAIIDCISYILFDTLTRMTKPSDDIIRKGEDTGYGILEFKIGKTRYKVVRGRRKSRPYCKFSNLSRKKELTERKTADTNEKIVKQIGMDFSIFRNSILFGQGDVSRFANLTDSGRKEIFCSLIKQLNEIEQQYQTVKDKTTIKEDKLNELMLDAGFPEKTKEAAKLMKISADKEFGKKLKYEKKVKEIEKKLSSNKTDKLYGRLEKLDKNIRIKKRKVEEIKYRIDTSIQRRKNDIKDLESDLEGKCSKCKQPLKNKLTKKEIKKTKEHIEKLKRLIELSEEEFDSIPKIKKEIKTLVEKREKLKDKFNNSKYKEQNEYMKKFKKYSSLVSRHEVEMKDYQKEEKELWKQYQKEIKKQGKIKKLQKEVRDLSIIEAALHKTGIQQDIIDDLIPVFEEKVKKYLRQLCDGISVRFSTTVKSKDGKKDIDKFSILVYNGKNEVNYNLIGGGLRKRIQIAISLALSDFALEQSGISTDFILLDEVFGELDDAGRDAVIKLLRNLRKRFKKMIIISHISEVQDLINNQIEIKQVNGVSQKVP